MSGDSVPGGNAGGGTRARGGTGTGTRTGTRGPGPGSPEATRRRSDAAGTTSKRTVALETGKRVLTTAKRGLWTALARPTASDVAMVVWTLSIGLLVGSRLVGLELAGLATGAGLGAALATMLLASDRPVVRGFGGAVAVPVAVFVSSPMLLAGALAVASSGVGFFAGLSVWALIIAALAAGLVSWDRLGSGGVRRGATGTMLAAFGVLAVVVLRIVPESAVRDRAGTAAMDVLGSAGEILVAAADSWAVVSFAGLLLVAAFASSRTLGYLPLERLVPPDRRGSLAAGIERSRWGCSLAVRVAIALTVAAFAASSVTDRIESVPIAPAELCSALPAPAGDVIATLVTSSGVRIALLSLVAVTLSLALLEWVRRVLGRNVARVLARLVAPAIGGAAVALVLARGLSETALEADLEGALEGTAPPSVVELLGAFPAFAIAAAILVAALFVLSSLLWSVAMLRALRILPARAIGAALAAGAVFCLAVGLAVVGQVEPAILTATGAFVLWDIGEYADGVRTELGREAATLRAELVHVGGSLLTGAVVAGGAIACYRWVLTDASITDPAHAAIAVGTGLLAVVLVTWALRG
ncbi:DUF7519 family protein [Natronorubrum halalkaliphilum]|uniref:DUF7519 family protein n=1 Tax=Natronorubrum halalkaliphilum TaxID=2691917 RepID=UPI001915EB8D|nr:hypothetical protein [Natronorubrum halalkaliphilum]